MPNWSNTELVSTNVSSSPNIVPDLSMYSSSIFIRSSVLPKISTIAARSSLGKNLGSSLYQFLYYALKKLSISLIYSASTSLTPSSSISSLTTFVIGTKKIMSSNLKLSLMTGMHFSTNSSSISLVFL